LDKQSLKMSLRNCKILNPQEKIPNIQSKYTVIKNEIKDVDLNEGLWATEYFVVFFHTGPHDPISTKLLRSLDQVNNPGLNEFPCKIITVSMDSAETIKDWIQNTNLMSDFDIPMLSDRENDLAGQFGVLMDSNTDHPGAGYCANAVFIVDNFNKIRYHEVMDARMTHDIDELRRIVQALKITDLGEEIAMAGWQNKNDSVSNSRKEIKKWHELKYGKGAKKLEKNMQFKDDKKLDKEIQFEDPVNESDETKNENHMKSWSYSSGTLLFSNQ